jgi:cadmium resistance protein CadD (predicted permease)
MDPNVGMLDRLIRIVVGVAVLSLAFIGPETPLGYLGIIPLATGVMAWCPGYALLGINTCKLKRH